MGSVNTMSAATKAGLLVAFISYLIIPANTSSQTITTREALSFVNSQSTSLDGSDPVVTGNTNGHKPSEWQRQTAESLASPEQEPPAQHNFQKITAFKDTAFENARICSKEFLPAHPGSFHCRQQWQHHPHEGGRNHYDD